MSSFSSSDKIGFGNLSTLSKKNSGSPISLLNIISFFLLLVTSGAFGASALISSAIALNSSSDAFDAASFNSFAFAIAASAAASASSAAFIAFCASLDALMDF